MSKIKPTDEQILEVMHGTGLMTYVIGNRLRWKFPGLCTPFVLRRLKAMEKAGKVERIPTTYAVQLCWRVKKGGAE